MKQNKITKKPLICTLIAASFLCIATTVNAETIICKKAHDTTINSKPIFGWTYSKEKDIMETPFGNLREEDSIDSAYAKNEVGTYKIKNRNFYIRNIRNRNVVQYMHGEVEKDGKPKEWFITQVGNTDNYTYTDMKEDTYLLQCREERLVANPTTTSAATPTTTSAIAGVGEEEGVCFFSTPDSEMVLGLENVANTAKIADLNTIETHFKGKVNSEKKKEEAISKRDALAKVCKKNTGEMANCVFRWSTLNRDTDIKLITAFGAFYSSKSPTIQIDRTPKFNPFVMGSKFVVNFVDDKTGKRYNINIKDPTSGDAQENSSSIGYKKLLMEESTIGMRCFSDTSLEGLKQQLKTVTLFQELINLGT